MTVSLDWDDDDKLRIHGLFPTDTVNPIQPARETPGGLSAASSIEKADGEAPPPRHRPSLEPPKRHYMLDLLDIHQGIEGAVSKELTVFKKQSSSDLATIDRLEKEREEALRKNAEDAASRSRWNVLNTVAQYIASGASIAVGASLGPTGWGGLLITSGVVGLGNRVVQDTVGWQTMASWFTASVENQKRLAARIEMGIFAVELGTGLAGGLGAAYTGAFSALAADTGRLAAARKMKETLATSSSAMQLTAQFGKTTSDKRMSDLQSRMRFLDAHAERIRMEMTSQATDARSMIDTALAVGQELHKAIAASEVHDL